MLKQFKSSATLLRHINGPENLIRFSESSFVKVLKSNVVLRKQRIAK